MSGWGIISLIKNDLAQSGEQCLGTEMENENIFTRLLTVLKLKKN